MFLWSHLKKHYRLLLYKIAEPVLTENTSEEENIYEKVDSTSEKREIQNGDLKFMDKIFSD